MDNDEHIERLATVFQALSDPNRLRILELLVESPHAICVNGIAMRIEISQSAVSQHLKILRTSGLLTVKKEGYYKHYSVNPAKLDEIRTIRAAVLGEDFRL